MMSKAQATAANDSEVFAKLERELRKSFIDPCDRGGLVDAAVSAMLYTFDPVRSVLNQALEVIDEWASDMSTREVETWTNAMIVTYARCN